MVIVFNSPLYNWCKLFRVYLGNLRKAHGGKLRKNYTFVQPVFVALWLLLCLKMVPTKMAWKALHEPSKSPQEWSIVDNNEKYVFTIRQHHVISITSISSHGMPGHKEGPKPSNFAWQLARCWNMVSRCWKTKAPWVLQCPNCPQKFTFFQIMRFQAQKTLASLRKPSTPQSVKLHCTLKKTKTVYKTLQSDEFLGQRW